MEAPTVSCEGMLTRQKLLLALIQDASGSLARIPLFKYAFLLSQEGDLPSALPFYDFVPFKYGPYSFGMLREMQGLERYGYIVSDPDQFRIAPGMGRAVLDVIRTIPDDVRKQISSMVAKYRGLSQHELLRRVYSAYPAFTFRSKCRELIPTSAAEPRPAPFCIYTLGYERKSIDSFLNLIVQNGLKQIIDVRANPVSRKYGFAKSTLSTLAAKLSVGYSHIPLLGIPGRDRKNLGTPQSYVQLLDDYEARILPVRAEPKQDVLRRIKAQPSVLVCMEEHPSFCHRGRLAKILASESGLSIQHL